MLSSRSRPCSQGVRPGAAVRPHRTRRLEAGAAGILIAVAAGLWGASAQEVVTFEAALARAVAAEPGVDAAAAGVDAARHGVRQASRPPNPMLSIEAEDWGGSGPLRGVDSLETTASIEQRWERGGDRRARRGVAQGDLAIAESAATLRRLDLLRDVQEAYIAAAAAAARRDLARERLEVAQSVRSTVADRVERALDPAAALSRADLELESARAGLAAFEAEEAAARGRLAGFWAEGTPADFAVDIEAFYDPGAHAREVDDIDIAQSPDLALVQAAQARADAAVDLEVARGVQDVDVSIGARRFNAGDDTAYVAGVTIPLAVLDRNRAGIAAARSERARLAYEADSVRRTVQRDIASGQRMRAAALARVDALEERIIPQAEQVLERAREGYARGAFSSLEVLDAQRTLHDARESLVEALADYHTADAALDRLTARFADPLPGEETEP